MKFIAKIIIIIALFAAGFYFGQGHDLNLTFFSQPSGQTGTQRSAVVNLMLDFGDGDVRVFNNIDINANISAFDLLQKVATDNNLELKYNDYGGDMGMFIESIDGVKNRENFWQYWVNNKYAEIGVSNYYLQAGDIVEWKYTKGQLKN